MKLPRLVSRHGSVRKGAVWLDVQVRDDTLADFLLTRSERLGDGDLPRGLTTLPPGNLTHTSSNYPINISSEWVNTTIPTVHVAG